MNVSRSRRIVRLCSTTIMRGSSPSSANKVASVVPSGTSRALPFTKRVIIPPASPVVILPKIANRGTPRVGCAPDSGDDCDPGGAGLYERLHVGRQDATDGDDGDWGSVCHVVQERQTTPQVAGMTGSSVDGSGD